METITARKASDPHIALVRKAEWRKVLAHRSRSDLPGTKCAPCRQQLRDIIAAYDAEAREASDAARTVHQALMAVGAIDYDVDIHGRIVRHVPVTLPADVVAVAA